MADIDICKESPEMLEFIKKEINYDPISGILSKTLDSNNVHIGNKRYNKTTGLAEYVRMHVIFNNKTYWFRGHRIAWALFYNRWPEDSIDHINEIRNDNRIANLQIMTSGENTKKSLTGRPRPQSVIDKLVGRVVTAETRTKIGAANKNSVRTAEQKAHASEIGRLRKGKVSRETREKTSASMLRAHLEHPRGEEWGRRISCAKKGKKWSDTERESRRSKKEQRMLNTGNVLSNLREKEL